MQDKIPEKDRKTSQSNLHPLNNNARRSFIHWDPGYYVMQISNVVSTSPHIIGQLVSVVLANRRTM